MVSIIEKDWKWQLANSITTIDELIGLFPYLNDKKDCLEKLIDIYPVKFTPYYLSLIDKSDKNDPILKQFLPNCEELNNNGEEDPIGEDKFYVKERVIHHYKDRVLLIINNFCPVNCRFCMRKRNWRKSVFSISKSELMRLFSI